MRLSAEPNNDFVSSSDEQITALACAGNQDAFAELIQRNYRRSRLLALGVISNPVEVEDLLSESIYKAYVHLDQLVGGQFAPWFNRIVLNQCYQHLRACRRTRRVFTEDEAPDERLYSIRSSELSPELQVGSSELASLLTKEIARLPVELRMPLLLSLHRRSIIEIGQELGISISAAKSRLFRARNLLRRRFSRHLPSTARRARIGLYSARKD